MRIQNQLLFVALLMFSLSYAAITNASIVRADNQALSNMSWEPGTMKAYVDGAAGNPDITLMACGDAVDDVRNKYATFVYRTGNISGFTVVAKEPSNSYTQLSTCAGACCWGATNYNFNSLYAVYPAHVYAIISTDTVFDESDTLVYVGPSTHLRGYYTQSALESSYNQATGNVTFNIGANDVQSWTGSAYATNSEDHPYFYIGVCDPTANLYYWGCQGGRAGVSRGTAYSVHTGVVSPPDTAKYTKYWVVNGIGTAFCIGADPSVTAVSLNPSTQYSGGTVNVTVSIRNDGNVDITQTFNVTVNVSGVGDVQNLTVSGLSAYTTTTQSFNLTLTNYPSGTRTVGARIATASIADCDSTNNYASATLTVEPAYNVHMYINGVENNTFPDAGRPYNISVKVNDTDGNTPDVLVRVYEVNGINLFAPIQVLSTAPARGLSPISYGQSITSGGMTNFTIIPTGNKLYTPEYAYTNIGAYVGNYSLYIEVFNATTGEELQQTNGTALIDQFNITLLNMSVRTPESNEHPIAVDNQDDYVQLMTEFMNDVFANVARWWLQ